MEDGLAREGVLVLCNEDRNATSNDAECDAARRAAAAVAAQSGEGRQAQLEQESERKMIAMRDRDELQERAAAQAAAQAEAERAAAYDAQWRDPKALPAADDVEPFDPFNPFAVQVPRHPPLENAAVAPPKTWLEITVPELGIQEPALIPRPFRTAGDDSSAAR